MNARCDWPTPAAWGNLAGGSSKNIRCADGDITLPQRPTRLLTREGDHALRATDGAGALEVWDQAEFDLELERIWLDMNLLDPRNWEAIPPLDSRKPFPLIVVSGACPVRRDGNAFSSHQQRVNPPKL